MFSDYRNNLYIRNIRKIWIIQSCGNRNRSSTKLLACCIFYFLPLFKIWHYNR